MKINDLFFDNYDCFLDINLKKTIRIEALKNIMNIIGRMSFVPKYVEAIINAILDQLDNFISDEKIIRLYMDELSQYMGIKRNSKLVVVLSEENCISLTLKNYMADVSFMPGWTLVNNEDEFYDLYIKCGTKSETIVIPKEKLIDLYSICMYQMCINPSSYVISSNYKRHSSESKIIITGMSYTRNAIRKEYMGDGILSVANSSQDLYYDFLCFKNIYNKNKNIEKLIIGLAPYSLRYDLSKTHFDFRMFYYMGMLDECDAHNNESLVSNLIEYKKQVDLFVSNFGEHLLDVLYENIADRTKIESLEHRQYVFNPKDISTEEKNEMIRKFQKPYDITLQENKQILEEYIKYALDNHVKVYLFLPPYSNWYRHNWDSTYLDELLTYTEELSKRYDFELINFINRELPDYYFGDYAHLNNIGSIYITSKIMEYL